MDEPKLNEEELLLKGVPDSAREKLATSTPLWYYVLCEAQKNGKHLGPVGGRIVAEVLVGLLEGDPTSWLGKKPPTWNPGELNAGDFDTGKDFTMADLVRFAQRTA